MLIALSSILMAPAVPGAGLRAVGAGVKGLARNPVILAIAGGALLATIGVAVPAPVERFLGFLGNAAGPTALFALGGVLGRMMGLDGFWVIAGVLLAVMPIATNAFVLAQRHDAGAEEVSARVLLSTLLTALALPVTAWLLSASVIGP